MVERKKIAIAHPLKKGSLDLHVRHLLLSISEEAVAAYWLETFRDPERKIPGITGPLKNSMHKENRMVFKILKEDTITLRKRVILLCLTGT